MQVNLIKAYTYISVLSNSMILIHYNGKSMPMNFFFAIHHFLLHTKTPYAHFMFQRN